MTNKKAIEILEAKIDCMEKQIEAICEKLPYYCDKCTLGHKQGNIVDQKEALKLSLKVLQGDLCYKATILEKIEQAKRNNDHAFNRYNKYYVLSIENYDNDVDNILNKLIKEIGGELKIDEIEFEFEDKVINSTIYINPGSKKELERNIANYIRENYGSDFKIISIWQIL